MKATDKKYTVILNDFNNTIVYTNSLEKIVAGGKKSPKFPGDARIIDNSTIKPKAEIKERTSKMFVIDTTPCIELQKFLSEIFQIENRLVDDLGFEFRRKNPVQY